MKEVIEFRVPEEHARRYLPSEVGTRLGDSIRKVLATPDDPSYVRIGEIERAHPGDGFFGWEVRRKYSRAELARADAFLWLIGGFFEPAGEECGTVYKDINECRTGRRQLSELILDLKRVPKKDVSQTIGREVVISERFAALLRSGRFTGMRIEPVRDLRASRQATPRFQVIPDGPPVHVLSPPTQFGINPFDRDPNGQYRCPEGDVAGWNLLSEATVDSDEWPNLDLVRTVEYAGNPYGRGLVVPMPLWLISPRLFRLIESERILGSRVEVAHVGGANDRIPRRAIRFGPVAR